MKPLSTSLLYQLWKKNSSRVLRNKFPAERSKSGYENAVQQKQWCYFSKSYTCDVQAQGLSTPFTVYILKMCNPGKYDNLTADMATRKQKVTFLPILTRNCTTFLSSRPSKKFFDLAHFGITPRQVHRIDKKLNFQPPPERLSISFIKLLKLNFISAFSIQLSSKWAIIGLIKKKTCGLQTLKNDLSDYGSPIMNIGHIKLTWTPSFLQRN